MRKTLKVNEKEFTIVQVYPYQYSYGEGKEVLRIKISRDNHSYTEIEQEFTSVVTDIEQYEDDIKVNNFTGYTEDFKCSYANNEFEVEITKITRMEKKLIDTQLAIADLAEIILGGKING